MTGSDDRDWKGQLVIRTLKNGETKIPAIAANAIVYLSDDPSWRGVVNYNAFRGTVVTTRTPPWDEIDRPADLAPGDWTDADTIRTTSWLARHHDVHFHPKTIEGAISVVSERRVVHPVRDWIRTLRWDGIRRIDGIFADYFGAEDSPYTRGVGARFVIGAVARVFEPGAKVDCTPVLEGPQGTGKSTAIRRLASDAWFFDTPIAMGEKDGYQALRGKWIGELGELHALNRTDLNRAKNFLTATCDTYRPSYGRRVSDFPRQCVFVGTTNATEYLRDETGNRRFWPVRCGQIDTDAIARDRDVLWAEAFLRYSARERWHVDTVDFARACESEQDARFVGDAWETSVEEWIYSTVHPERCVAGLTSGEVLGGAIGMATDRWTKADQDRVAAIMRRLGWERGKQARDGCGKRERRWRPRAPVTLVTSAVTDPVTRKSPEQAPSSPASPADLRTGRWADSGRADINRNGCDTGDAVTAPFADWVADQGIGVGE